MSEILSHLRPILTGLVGAAFVYLLIRLTKSESRKEGDVRCLEYSRAFKIFSFLLAPFSIFVAYAALHARQSQLILALVIASIFVVSAVFFAYQAFFVKFSYDDDYVYYSSPLLGKRKVAWSALKEVGYSKILQAEYIVVEGIGRIWCSNMLNGYAELGVFLEAKVQQLFPENES